MNEIIFFLHLFTLIIFLLLSLKTSETALIFFTVLQAILANLFVTKQIKLFGFIVTSCDVYAVGSIFALNFIIEYFGKEKAKNTIKLTFIALLFFFSMSKFNLSYFPSKYDFIDNSFKLVIKHSFRIILTSIFVFFLSQKVDVFCYSFFKKKFNLPFLKNSLFSNLIAQFVDTFLFSFLALYGILENIFHVIFISFFVKIISIFTAMPFIVFVKKLEEKKNEF